MWITREGGQQGTDITSRHQKYHQNLLKAKIYNIDVFTRLFLLVKTKRDLFLHEARITKTCRFEEYVTRYKQGCKTCQICTKVTN